MKLRNLLLLTLVPVALVLAAVLVREASWRRTYPLAKPQAAAPDDAFVAEVRAMPDSPLLAPRSSGVFVRARWALLRSVDPQLVFVGSCDNVDTRWMSRRRLVIECQLRSGEPRLLRALVEDVVIELVIQPHFAQGEAAPRLPGHEEAAGAAVGEDGAALRAPVRLAHAPMPRAFQRAQKGAAAHSVCCGG